MLVLLYEFPRKPVDGLPPARHTGAIGNPIPYRPSLFITWACLDKFLLDKTYPAWRSATAEVFFMYRTLILAEYEHDHLIMQLRLPSDFKFSWGAFLRFFYWKFRFSKEIHLIFENFKFLKFSKCLSARNNLIFGMYFHF